MWSTQIQRAVENRFYFGYIGLLKCTDSNQYTLTCIVKYPNTESSGESLLFWLYQTTQMHRIKPVHINMYLEVPKYKEQWRISSIRLPKCTESNQYTLTCIMKYPNIKSSGESFLFWLYQTTQLHQFKPVH